MNPSLRSFRAIKIALASVWVIGLLWVVPGSFSKSADSGKTKEAKTTTAKKDAKAPTTKKEKIVKAKFNPEDYTGSESCKACHEDMIDKLSKTKHGRLLANVIQGISKEQGCETCHGPGKAHIEAGGDKTKIIRFLGEPAKQVSETCLECHAGKEEHNNYRRGEHWRNDVGCTDCHSLHSSSPSTPKMLAAKQPQLCLSCHTEMKTEFSRPFHHKVPEGAINCTDCHNPHGGFEQKQLRTATGADAACLKCHTDKQGPFVFEHVPSKVEGCTICHSPHGSNNPKQLKRNNVAQLCIECHSSIGASIAPGTPSFHNLSDARFQNCTFCHAKIHGSNTSAVFFR